MVSRRQFLKSSTALGAAALAAPTALFAPNALAQAVAALAVDPTFPKTIPQFVNTLPNPLDPGFIWQPDTENGTTYTLEIQQFQQDLGLGTGAPTTVWGYGLPGDQTSGTFPGRTFELNQGSPIRVKYLNNLTVGGLGIEVLPNPMPVDTTLDWANPGAMGGVMPVPAVTHLHGGASEDVSDGRPDDWYVPGVDVDVDENGDPISTGKTDPVRHDPTLVDENGNKKPNGTVGEDFLKNTYTYLNDQEAGTLWYHDHALGITRTNVYMGLAGFYLLRDANENKLRADGVLPKHPYEVPIVIQDREFDVASQLFYPAGAVPINSHLPEFFGRVILVNGKAWPKMVVEPRKYRLRMLNGSDSRFYDLRFEVFGKDAQITPGNGTPVPVMVIGNELGLLDVAVGPELTARPGPRGGTPGVPGVLAIGPGERYDVIVDFTTVPAGSRVVITNSANSPYPDAAKPLNKLTDRIMAFDVAGTPPTGDATVTFGSPPLRTDTLGPVTIPAGTATRRILLFEGTDALGRLQTMLGPVDEDPVTKQVGTLTFKDPITERPSVGQEVWEFYNATVDAHPLHMHLVDFRVIDRDTFTGTLTAKLNTDRSNGAILTNPIKTGAALPVSDWEAGKKDTVKLFPGEVTRVLVSFLRPGKYVYHCHILSHEDHEMMRPYEVI